MPLLAPFKDKKLISYEKVGKTFKQVGAVRKISYTPDFVGSGWIMETKGKKTPDFSIRWKLFKQYLVEHDMYPILLMPTNKKEIITSIEIIKELCITNK